MKVLIQYQIIDDHGNHERTIAVGSYSKAFDFIRNLKKTINIHSDTGAILSWYQFKPLMKVIK